MVLGVTLDHLFIVVSDLERSKHFYTDVLGLEVTFEGGGYVRFRGESGFSIGMEQRPAGQVGGRGIEIVVLVDDVDRRYHEMSAKGATFAGPPADQEWGARHAWLEDPDGYPMSIFTPLDQPA
jgi:catechol 2,3-dioxygenase-like lactoylglutathione lyase family enzyme